MRFDLLCVLALSLGICFVVGCGEKPAPTPATNSAAPAAAPADEAKFAEAIAKLPEEDRAAATAQKFCAVENKSRLGSMGMPFKVTIEDKPVFLCCEGCKDEALKDPQATLAKVAELKQAVSPKAAE